MAFDWCPERAGLSIIISSVQFLVVQLVEIQLTVTLLARLPWPAGFSMTAPGLQSSKTPSSPATALITTSMSQGVSRPWDTISSGQPMEQNQPTDGNPRITSSVMTRFREAPASVLCNITADEPAPWPCRPTAFALIKGFPRTLIFPPTNAESSGRGITRTSRMCRAGMEPTLAHLNRNRPTRHSFWRCSIRSRAMRTCDGLISVPG